MATVAHRVMRGHRRGRVTGMFTMIRLSCRMDLRWCARKRMLGAVSAVALVARGYGELVGGGAHVCRDGLAGAVVAAFTDPTLQVVEGRACRVESDRRGLGEHVGFDIDHARTGRQGVFDTAGGGGPLQAAHMQDGHARRCRRFLGGHVLLVSSATRRYRPGRARRTGEHVRLAFGGRRTSWLSADVPGYWWPSRRCSSRGSSSPSS